MCVWVCEWVWCIIKIVWIFFHGQIKTNCSNEGWWFWPCFLIRQLRSIFAIHSDWIVHKFRLAMMMDYRRPCNAFTFFPSPLHIAPFTHISSTFLRARPSKLIVPFSFQVKNEPNASNAAASLCFVNEGEMAVFLALRMVEHSGYLMHIAQYLTIATFWHPFPPKRHSGSAIKWCLNWNSLHSSNCIVRTKDISFNTEHCCQWNLPLQALSNSVVAIIWNFVDTNRC